MPLDYQNIHAGHAFVPLVKYPAQANSSTGEYRGMILLHPGGPGQSGTEQALGYAPTVQVSIFQFYKVLGALNLLVTCQAAVGSNFDIIGFNPRGIYSSEPVANCSVNAPSPQDAINPRSTPRMTDDYYHSWIEYGIELGKVCNDEVGGELDAGPHMSTATTARDMLSIVDAFAATADGQAATKPSELLNYYGISYGTFLGQTFASMFPDRVGSVVLDGVVSPEGYLANYTWSSVTHLDGVISAFFIQCHQVGLSGCSFSTGSSPRDIHGRFQKLFAQLDVEEASTNNWSNASEIESALLLFKIALLTTANHPTENFDLLPDVLVKLESAFAAPELDAWIVQAEKLYGDPTVGGAIDLQYSAGILCSDMENRWYNKTLDDLKPLLADLNNKSIVGDIWIKSMLACLGWSIRATETFQGPFGGDTANPILFVGNTYDPVTPYDKYVFTLWIDIYS